MWRLHGHASGLGLPKPLSHALSQPQLASPAVFHAAGLSYAPPCALAPDGRHHLPRLGHPGAHPAAQLPSPSLTSRMASLTQPCPVPTLGAASSDLSGSVSSQVQVHAVDREVYYLVDKLQLREAALKRSWLLAWLGWLRGFPPGEWVSRSEKGEELVSRWGLLFDSLVGPMVARVGDDYRNIYRLKRFNRGTLVPFVPDKLKDLEDHREKKRTRWVLSGDGILVCESRNHSGFAKRLDLTRRPFHPCCPLAHRFPITPLVRELRLYLPRVL